MFTMFSIFCMFAFLTFAFAFEQIGILGGVHCLGTINICINICANPFVDAKTFPRVGENFDLLVVLQEKSPLVIRSHLLETISTNLNRNPSDDWFISF